MKISVIINVHNCESYMYKCVDSMLAQKYDDFEILLIDNGSTDKSKIICDEYTMKDLRVKSIHLDTYSGIENAFKTGVREANGQYVTFVNGETYFDRQFLLRIAKTITTYSSDFIFCDCVINNGIRNIRTHLALIENGIYEKDRIASEIMPRMFSDISPVFSQVITTSYKAKIYDINLIKNSIEFYDQNKCTEWENTITLYALKHCNKMFYMKNEYLYYYKEEPLYIDSFFDKCINYFKLSKLIIGDNKTLIDNFDEFRIHIILNYIDILAKHTDKNDKNLITDKIKEIANSILFTPRLHIKDMNLTVIHKIYIFLLKNKLYKLLYILIKYISKKQNNRI